MSPKHKASSSSQIQNPPLPSAAWLATGLVGLVALALFAPTTAFDFTDWDDRINIYENPYLNPVSAAGLRFLWTHPFEHLYIPLVYSSFALDTLVWGIDRPGGFHATNALIHALAAMVAYRLLRNLLGRSSGAAAGALIGALLFAIHPLQVEPVTWVTGRKDVLSGLFSLLALFAYVRWSRLPRPRTYLLASTAYLVALLAKPAAVAVPLMALALELFLLKNSRRRTVLALLPWVLLAVVWMGVTKQAQPPAEYSDPDVPVWQRPFVAADALIFYLHKLVLPAALVAIYDRTPSNVLAASRWVYAAPLVPLALVLLLARSSALLRTAGALVFAGILPVLGLVRFEYQNYSTVADRYFYLSMLGIALAAATLCQRWFDKSLRPTGLWLRRLLPIGALVVLAMLSVRQQRTWRNSLTLWQHNVRFVPQCSGARFNLANNIRDRDLPQAITHYEEAVVAHPNYHKARLNLGIALLTRGDELAAQDRRADAVEEFQRSARHFEYMLELQPDRSPYYFMPAQVYERLGDLRKAERLYRQAAQFPPPIPEAHTNLARLLWLQGKIQEARRHYEAALRIDPKNQAARRGLEMTRSSTLQRSPDP